MSIYFLFFNKQKRVQNFWFGLLVLFLSLRIGKSVYRIFASQEEIDLLVMQIGLSACFLIGVSLFYYIKASIENRKSIPKSWIVHFSILFLFISIVGIVKPYTINYEFWRFFVWIIYGAWGLYILASSYLLKDIVKKLFSKTSKCTTAELWLIAVFMANALIFTAYIVGYFFLYLVGTITFSVVFYALLIFFLSKKNRETIFQKIPEKYETKKIENEEAALLIEKLNSLMKVKELYKNTNVKLLDIAKEIHITPHKLSQLLNDNIGKSFAAFLNTYRIDEAKNILRENKSITLEAVGFEAGFSSKSNFYATFKKIVGQTPAQYQKQFL
ncbi:helix-turn-helix domain-containing protein [uncultured Tenacibaculum sp.]|uniref:AraC family transcriptional regulator n=1 Tax=uncultured Tenacibaculum sp. TaxID=174713 RepID=UPI00260A736F|nr:helix-turn-helix domain-containing protein [uncultured Tenacibaculum sp.]